MPHGAVAPGWRGRPAGDGRHRLRQAHGCLPAELRQLLDDPQQSDAVIQWTRDQIEAAKPHSPGGSYLNFPGVGADPDAVREAYGPNYERLAKIKARYDPANMFRMNQNIVPLI